MKKPVKSSYQVMYLVPELIYSKLHSCIDDHMKEELSDIRSLHSDNTKDDFNEPVILSESNRTGLNPTEVNQTPSQNNETLLEESNLDTAKSSNMTDQNQSENSKFISFDKNVSDNFAKDLSPNNTQTMNFLENEVLSSTPVVDEKSTSLRKSGEKTRKSRAKLKLENSQEKRGRSISLPSTRIKKKFKCIFCISSFTIKHTFKEHLRKHKKDSECNICMKKITNKNDFIPHYNRHSSEDMQIGGGKKKKKKKIVKYKISFYPSW